MNITEVRVKLMHHRSDRLRAFCSVTIDDDFVVHDLRVIEGRKGFFVAMPSRKLTDNCPRCGAKNELKAKFCGECGGKLDEARAAQLSSARDKLHVDVAHPINTACREMVQATVLAAYRDEEGRATEGLPPLHDYAPEEVEGVADEYAELGPEEPQEALPQEAEFEEAEPEPEEEAALAELLVEAGEPEAEPEPEEEAPLAELLVEAGELDAEPEPEEEAPLAELLVEAGEPEAEPTPEARGPEQAEEAGVVEEAPEAEEERQRSRGEREGGGFGEGIL